MMETSIERKLGVAMCMGVTQLRGNLLPPWYDDVRVSVNSVKLAGLKQPGFEQFADNGSGSVGVFTYLFDAATEEEVFFEVQMPHGVQLNTPISPHVHWAPVADGTAGQVVCWGLEYVWQDVFGVFGDTTILYGNEHVGGDSILLANKHYLTPLADLSDANTAVSSVLLARLFRDATGGGATDSYTDDAALLSVDFHVTLDAPGSSSLYSK
jgi:hypothetical protein